MPGAILLGRRSWSTVRPQRSCRRCRTSLAPAVMHTFSVFWLWSIVVLRAWPGAQRGAPDWYYPPLVRFLKEPPGELCSSASPREQMSSTWPTPSNPATPCSLRPSWWLARAVLRSSRHAGRPCAHGLDSTCFWNVECLDGCDTQWMTDCIVPFLMFSNRNNFILFIIKIYIMNKYK